MAPRLHQMVVVLLAALLFFPAVGRLSAQCSPGRVTAQDAVLQAIFASEKAETDDASVQVSAPSSSSSSTATVDRPSFPAVVGMAIDNGLVKADDNAITVDLNLFAFLGMFHPVALTSPMEYQKHDFMRRFGGAVTFGGKGDRFDLTGNEQTDPPSDRRTDVVHYEFRYRLTSQSRDVREAYNASEFTLPAKDQANFGTAFQALLTDQAFHDAIVALNQDSAGCVDARAISAVLAQPQFHEELAKVQASAAQLGTDLTAARKKVENRPVFTFVVGGVQQKEAFGPNSLKIALRGEIGRQTLNAEWRRSDELANGTRPTIFKGGWEGSLLWLKGSRIAPDGIDVSVSAVLERFQDVPDAKHSTIGTLNFKFEYPLSKAVKIPFSITWANHKDLLTDEANVQGHIGFTVDIDKALKLGQ